MWYKKLLTIFIGLLISFLLCEIILRIYNPFQSRIRGNEIILKSNYKKRIVIDPHVPGLDDQIAYSTNSIGFRGPEPPKEWDKSLTVFTVGGSTTECSLLADDSTWSAKLYDKLKKEKPDLWLNNAGLDGCSTYGHIILMRDYIIKLKPDYVVFLVGINDLVKANFSNEDGFLINRKEAWWRKIMKRSELITLISNIREAMKSQKANVAHGSDPYDYKKSEFNNTDSVYRKELEQKISKFIPEYIERIAQLSKLCIDNGIKPVFVTQPKFDDAASNSWHVMEEYNNALMQYCQTSGIPCIDLGSKMPKEQTAYYYDQIHFTNAGAEKISEILAPELIQILNK